MNADERDQFVERWLDRALAHYSDAEPRAGFEGRILASLTAQEVERMPAWRGFIWIPAFCAATVALVGGVSLLWQTKRPSSNPSVVVTTHCAPVQVHLPASVATNSRPKVQRPRVSRTIAKVSEPRQEQFPAPSPPTEQEHLLAAYLSATPTHELLAVAADQQAWRDQLQKRAEAIAPEPAGTRDINHLKVSPLEGGNIDAGAFGTR
jgi:hypothetical protein